MARHQKKNKNRIRASKLDTFPITHFEEEIEDNTIINTNTPSKPSEGKIINLAFRLHSQGNISGATKYYQHLINQGCKNPAIFCNYGAILQSLGRLDEAELSTRKAIKLNPNFENAHSNLAGILKDQGKLLESELHGRKAIELNPNFTNAHFNLGNTLKDLGKLKEAEIVTRKAIDLNPNLFNSHLLLGKILIEQRKLKEAEIATRKAIELNPNFAQSHLNLGVIMTDLGKLKEAERSTRKAIELNPLDEMAHLTLGSILIDLGNSKEAEISLRKTIELKPNSADAHRGLSIYYYLKKNIDFAFKSISKAYSFDPEHINNKILFNILKGEINHLKTKDKIHFAEEKSLESDPLILHRPVEKQLIETLYKIKAQDQAKLQGPTYGVAIGSNYELFDRKELMIKTIKEELINISVDSIKSDIFIVSSFFTIFRSGGGLVSHNHLNRLDLVKGLNLARRKYSLVYYLSVGDQNCDEPGILKLEDPNQEILPNNGLIIIFPAGRKHSVFYKGKKDRIIIGVNFYTI